MALGVLVIAIGAVDQNVAGLQARQQILNRRFGGFAGRQHEPGDARRIEAVQPCLFILAGQAAGFLGERLRDLKGAVEQGGFGPAAGQTAGHVGPHFAQTVNADFHRRLS